MILGLTGFSGAGKSTVAAIFKEHGFYHLDCDHLVHNKVYRDPIVLNAIAKSFGKDLIKNGHLDRAALRSRTVGDLTAMKKLNETVMPYILAHIQGLLDTHRNVPVILDAPLLFESGLHQKCDKVLSVIADPANALERIMERDGLTRAEAEKRLASQHPAEYYTEKSDYVFINNEGIQELTEQALELLQKIHDQAL